MTKLQRRKKEAAATSRPPQAPSHVVVGDLHQNTNIAFVANNYPPTDYLRSFEEVVPGAADRILKMAESAQAHGQAMQSAELRYSRRGQWFGFGVVAMGMATGGFFAYQDHAAAGAVVASGVLVALAAIFIGGRTAALAAAQARQAAAPGPSEVKDAPSPAADGADEPKKPAQLS